MPNELNWRVIRERRWGWSGWEEGNKRCRRRTGIKKQAIWWDGITLAKHIQPSSSCLINTYHRLRRFMCMRVRMWVWVNHCRRSKWSFDLEMLDKIQKTLAHIEHQNSGIYHTAVHAKVSVQINAWSNCGREEGRDIKRNRVVNVCNYYLT